MQIHYTAYLLLTDAVAGTRGEGHIGVGTPVGSAPGFLALGKTLRHEPVGVGEDEGITVEQEVAEDDIRVGGNLVAVNFQGLGRLAGHQRYTLVQPVLG
jgi:hypothetical protein